MTSAFIRELRPKHPVRVSVSDRVGFIGQCISEESPYTDAVIGAMITLARDRECNDEELRSLLNWVQKATEQRFLKDRRTEALLDARFVGNEFHEIAEGSTTRKDILHSLESLKKRYAGIVGERLKHAPPYKLPRKQ